MENELSEKASLKNILLASGNRHKFNELRELLSPLGIEAISGSSLDITEVEEDGKTFLANADLKVEAYAKKYPGWILADDSGLAVDILDGAPGIHSARYAGADFPEERIYEKLLDMLNSVPLEKRSARYHCALVLRSPSGKKYAIEETVEGIISFKPVGKGGFGYDPVFYYPPQAKTFGQMSLEEKQKISHRGKALALLSKIIKLELHG